MLNNLLETIQNQFHALTSQRTSRRRRRVNSVSPEQLESRHLLSAVVGPVVDYATGPASVSRVDQTVQLNESVVVFTMSTLAYGNELWRSDGTTEGTFRLTDISPGPAESGISYLTVVNEKAYFNVFRPGSTVVELWKTDGTVGGTNRISVPDQGESQQTAFFLTKYDDTHLAFVTNNDVWITDGTTGGTTKIVELSDSSLNINGLQFDYSLPGEERVYLATYQFVDNSYKSHLVRYDLQSKLTTILVTSDQGSNAIQLDTVYQGRLIFNLTDTEHGTELWYSDGTPETTALWMDINVGPDHSYPAEFTLDGESLYFFATAEETGWEVWLINDKNSLPQVIDIVPGTQSSYAKYFGMAHGLYLDSSTGIYRLSGATVTLIPDSQSSSHSLPVPIQGNANKLYFHTSGRHLSFYEGTNVQNVRTFGMITTFLGTTNESVLFMADDQISGLSIWKSDGTELGTSLVLDPEPGTMGSYPTALTNINGNLAYFTSDNEFFTHNSDLLQVTGTNQLQVIDSEFEWVYGTETAIVKNALQYQKTIGSSVQLSEWNGSQITRLTSSDFSGTPIPPLLQINGHRIVLLAIPNSLSSPGSLWTIDSDGNLLEKLAAFDEIDREGITEVGGNIYFRAYKSVVGDYRIWRTDGTAAGTIPISQLSPQFGSNKVYYSNNFIFADTPDQRGMVFLNGITDQVTIIGNQDNAILTTELLGSHGSDILLVRDRYQLWRTRGTSESTQFVTSLPGRMVNAGTASAGGAEYFILRLFGSENRFALWKTDGTGEGTSQVTVLPDYVSQSSVQALTEIDGKLFFAADNQTTGYSEVWTSDGTASGTMPIATNLTIDDQVTFVGYDGGIAFRAATQEVGDELFRIDTTIPVVAPNNISVHHYGEGVDLTWPDVTGAIQYDIWMQNLSDPSAPVIKKRVNAPRLSLLDDMGYFIDNQIGSSAYRIWVRSLPVLGDPSAWSVAKDFTVAADPVLFSTSLVTTNTKPTFQWAGPSDVVSYEIWLTNRDTKTRVFNSTGLTSTSFQVDQTLTPARYAVWVRGTRTDGTRTNWSTVNEFNVVQPAIEFTGGVGIQRTSRPTFTWPLVTGATGYNLQVAMAGTSTVVYEMNDLKGLSHVPAMDLPAGNYTVRLQAMKGNRPLSAWGAGQTVRVLIPPVNLRSTGTGFAWDAVPTAVSYTYELRNSLTQAVLYSKTQIGTTFTPPAPLSPGQYTLRVYASFVGSSSNRASLAYEVFQPATVSITSSSAATADATPTIAWVAVTGAVKYEVVVTRGDITTPVYNRLNIVGTSHRIDMILSPETYQIQVRAIFADGSRTNLSAKQQLVIGPAPVVSFANGVLNWNSINGATHYELWVNYLGTPVKSKIVYQPNTLQTSFTLPGTLPKGSYRAWVRAVRAEGGDQYAGRWSVARNFEIL